MLHSLLTSGGRPQTTLTNIVANGNFVNTTGWSVDATTTIAASNNILSLTGTGTSMFSYVSQTTNLDVVLNKKIYLALIGRVTNTSATAIAANVFGSGGGNIEVATVNAPTQNQLYALSAVATLTGAFVGKVGVRAQHRYANAATANGKVMEIQKVLALDLTTIFGAGSEPTAAQVERWLAIFSAGWFSTTKLIPKRIY